MQSFLTGTGYTLLYILICAGSALLIRRFTRIPDEPFRKLLHGILQGFLLVFVCVFSCWQHAVLFCVLFSLAVYPVLWFCERFRLYAWLLTERKHGELKNSLLVVFAMFSLVIAVCWGILDDRMLALASIYAWGFGDAAAALVGKAYGKHKIPGTKKSWEGTLSMFAVSFITVALILLLRSGISLSFCLLTAVITAAVSAAVELYTPGGYDTITCPVSAMAVLLLLLYLPGGSL